MEGIWCCWLTTACLVSVAHYGTNKGLICPLAIWQNSLPIFFFFLDRAIFRCTFLPSALANLDCPTTFSSVGVCAIARSQPFSNSRTYYRQICLSLQPMSQKNYRQKTSLESEDACSEPQQLFNQPAFHWAISGSPVPSFLFVSELSPGKWLCHAEGTQGAFKSTVIGSPNSMQPIHR